MKLHQNMHFKKSVDFVEIFLSMKKGFLPHYVKFISRCNRAIQVLMDMEHTPSFFLL